MNFERTKTAPSVRAALTSDEKTARKVADLVAESLSDEVAVSLTEAVRGRWQVTIYCRETHDETSLRALAAVAAGPGAGRALVFERLVRQGRGGANAGGYDAVP